MNQTNWYIYRLYTRREFDLLKDVLETQLSETKGSDAYALYVKGLVLRREGKIQDSLSVFQAAACLKPNSVETLKQVGKTLHLMGKHARAIEVFQEARQMMPSEEDRDIWHNIGLCHLATEKYTVAIECFERANAIRSMDETYAKIGEAYRSLSDKDSEIETYVEALDVSPSNPKLLTELGLTYLRNNQMTEAFEYLGNALAHDRSNVRAALAVGSVLQDHEDVDVALSKYRKALLKAPNSSQLWNNIGMCYFTKHRYVAAIVCLKRASYLDPFGWIVSYNLGLCYLQTGQHASAFRYLKATIQLNDKIASAFAHLGVALGRLGDFENGCRAFDRAIKLDPDDPMIWLNFTIVCLRGNFKDRAREAFDAFNKCIGMSGNSEDLLNDDEIQSNMNLIQEILGH